jgi:hypothetical protein
MTKDYFKPSALVVTSVCEGVYMASGDTVSNGTPGCDSQYTGGVWQAPNYNTDASYMARLGCTGCPAFRYNGCGIQMEEYWGSYDVDNGNRMPDWERKGHYASEPINWNTYDL